MTNKLVRDLVLQAHKNGGPEVLSGRKLAMENFVELMIQECVDILADPRFDNVRPSMNIAQSMIKERFGVTEK